MHASRRRARILAGTNFLILVVALPAAAGAQSAGSILGRVLTHDSVPIAGATVSVIGAAMTALTNAEGRFALTAVLPGVRAVRVEQLGFTPIIVEGIVVSLGRTTSVRIEMETQPVAVPGVTVEAQRVRLIEPDVSATREIVLGTELRVLPVDRLDQVIELTPGVSGGHFRGGRAGQEVYIVDGVEVKNRLEASAHGFGLELPPGALDEVEVITGGVSASFGSALSGVVSYVTRRGSVDRWDGRAALLTDEWAPSSLLRGFNSLALSVGGPLRFMGANATLYVDVLAQGMADADPRARGLSCLRPRDADTTVAALIRSVRAAAPGLYCPYTAASLPHQQGDKLIGFARFDAAPLPGTHFMLSALRNRFQRELYAPEYRYSSAPQLGQRTTGTLVNAGMDWSSSGAGRARHLGMRLAFVRLDRYLGALDAAAFDDRTRIARAGFSSFRFLGEAFVRRPIEEQLASGEPVPGYAAPAGTGDSPFGAAGADLFFATGTPDVANWTRSDAFSVDVAGEILSASGSLLRAGANTRVHRIETYERLDAHLAGSSPSYARFYPVTLAAFVDMRLAGDDELNLTAGVRVEAFRSGVRFRRDRGDFLAPVLEPGWQVAAMPRLGVALPMPGTDGRTAVRFNYAQVAQPPDFRFFLDTTIGDSLRTAIQRQGNPELSFERGRMYELGASQIIGRHVGLSLTAFRKELRELASGGLRLGSSGNPQYSTNDVGTVKGLEVALRGQWPSLTTRAGWSLQKAIGVASGTDADTLLTEPIERPLAFDQRHAIDLAITLGATASDARGWTLALISSTRSGYPIDRRAAAGDTVLPGQSAYLPWTSTVDLRVSRVFGALPGCARCTWRIVADARNALGRSNVLALRRESGQLAPSAATVQQLVAAMPAPGLPIPLESPLYARSIDLDGNGRITPQEFNTARLAAVLDRMDPSLFFGEARSVRLGLEVTF